MRCQRERDEEEEHLRMEEDERRNREALELLRLEEAMGGVVDVGAEDVVMDGDEVDDVEVGGSVGGNGDVGAGDGGASGSDIDAMSIDSGRVGGGEVGDEGGGPAKLVWQFKQSIEDPCVIKGVMELHMQVMSIEASLAQVVALLVVLVEDLEDRLRGFSRKRRHGLEARGLVVESQEKRARKEEEEK